MRPPGYLSWPQVRAWPPPSWWLQARPISKATSTWSSSPPHTAIPRQRPVICRWSVSPACRRSQHWRSQHRRFHRWWSQCLKHQYRRKDLSARDLWVGDLNSGEINALNITVVSQRRPRPHFCRAHRRTSMREISQSWKSRHRKSQRRSSQCQWSQQCLVMVRGFLKFNHADWTSTTVSQCLTD